jgi:membrane protein
MLWNGRVAQQRPRTRAQTSAKPAAPEEPFRNPLLARAWRFFSRDVWLADLKQMPWPRRWLYKFFRVLFLTGHGFVQDNCLFRASALTYITVLSLVPLLAFGFSVAKGFGAYERLIPALEDWIRERLSEGGSGEPTLSALVVIDAVHSLLEFVEKTDVRSLGLVGLALLLFTVIKLLGTVERSFNDIWGVQRPRTLLRKLSDYLAMVVFVPIFLATAIGVTSAAEISSVVEFLHLGPLLKLLANFASVFAMWLGFTFLYLALPNTRTKFSSAVIGGLVGGTLWHIAQILHVKFQIGLARYNPIYAGFAAIPIFLAWMHLSWVAVLTGAEVAFAHQSAPAYKHIAQSRPTDHAFQEIVALRTMTRVGATFLRGERPLAPSEIAAQIGVPIRPVEEVLAILVERGLLIAAETQAGEGYLPARDFGNVTIKTVLDALKGTSGPVDVPAKGPMDEELDSLLARLEGELEGSPHNRSLRDLAQEAKTEPAGDGKLSAS